MADFMQASRLVTGISDLDAGLEAEFLHALSATPALAVEHGAAMAACASALREEDPLAALKAALSADSAAAAGARRIAHLWYAGALPRPESGALAFTSPAAYFAAQLWRVAGAHPPGLSGGYFGHWRYAPDA